MYGAGQQVIEKINDEKNFLRGTVEKLTAQVSGKRRVPLGLVGEFGRVLISKHVALPSPRMAG